MATELIEATKEGNVAEVERQLPDAYLTAVDKKGAMALHWAAALGKTEILKILLNAEGAFKGNSYYFNKRDNNGSTALHLAVIHGNADAVAALLEHDEVEIDPRDQSAIQALSDEWSSKRQAPESTTQSHESAPPQMPGRKQEAIAILKRIEGVTDSDPHGTWEYTPITIAQQDYMRALGFSDPNLANLPKGAAAEAIAQLDQQRSTGGARRDDSCTKPNS